MSVFVLLSWIFELRVVANELCSLVAGLVYNGIRAMTTNLFYFFRIIPTAIAAVKRVSKGGRATGIIHEHLPFVEERRLIGLAIHGNPDITIGIGIWLQLSGPFAPAVEPRHEFTNHPRDAPAFITNLVRFRRCKSHRRRMLGYFVSCGCCCFLGCQPVFL